MRRGVPRFASKLKWLAGLVTLAGVLAVLAGCEVKPGQPDLVNGKKLFVQRCGACHQLARADTKGVVGPNLDQAFRSSVGEGLGRGTIRGVVERQILYPSIGGKMPPKLVTGRDAQDVAAYVASVAAKGGKDSGALAEAVGGAQKALAVARGGRLEIPADPNGRLLFQFKNAQAKSGPVTVSSKNPSSVPHDIVVEGNGIRQGGPVGQNGQVSSFKVTLKPGQYTFYCSVPGHREGGMVGKLTVN